jgi:hypothetical protein
MIYWIVARMWQKPHNIFMTDDRRTALVLNHLETVRADIEHSIDQSDSREHWRSLVRGVLLHWLGQVFDEGVGHQKDLQTSIEILQEQVKQLRIVNGQLRLELSKK